MRFRLLTVRGFSILSQDYNLLFRILCGRVLEQKVFQSYHL